MTSTSNSTFFHFHIDGRLTSNLGPLLFVYKGFLVIFFVLQKKIQLKKNPKKSFSHKKFPTERKFE